MSEPIIEDLLAECLARYETDGQPGIEEVISNHPDLAGELETGLAELESLGLLEAGRVFDEAALPRTFGEFERGERLGGGGMGVVFRATQASLAREVALKVIRPDQLYLDSARERFRREVESAARLQHESIVPVYAVGEEANVPYLAMELIPGCTLADAIARLRGRRADTLKGRDLLATVTDATREKGFAIETAATDLYDGDWVETCIRIARRLARALEHAHSRGILHRDVKPSNVMITPGGRVLLFDFGLVQAEGSARLTRTGAPVGSPAYMAPEQMRSSVSDARSDVYSLGVTLYELLALELPFLGKSYDDLRAQVLAGESEPITHKNRAVPWDVETVCLVAMDRDPARRYASVTELAADLDRIAQRQTIRARRPGVTLRARRFVQRHPAAVVGVLLGTLLCIGTPTALWLQQRSANAEIAAQKLEAERRMKLAIQTVHRFLTRFATNDVVLVPHMEDLTRDLLKDAITLFNNFLSENGNQPAFRGERANARANLALVYQRLGDIEPARKLAIAAVHAYERLHADNPDQSFWTFRLAEAHSLLASIYLDLVDASNAKQHLETSLSLFAALPEACDSDPVMQEALAVTEVRMATIDTLEERVADAKRRYEKAVAIRLKLAELANDRPEPRLKLASTYYSLGLLYKHDDEREKSADLHKKAIAILEKLVAAHPDHPIYRLQLARNLCRLSAADFELGRIDDALEDQQRGVALLERLAADFPRTLPWRTDLAVETSNLGSRLRRTGHMDRAERVLLHASEIFDSLTELAPKVWSARISHMRSLALLQAQKRQLDAAAGTLEKALSFVKSKMPPRAFDRAEIARIWSLLGTIERRRKHLGPAVRAYDAALAIDESLVAAHPTDSEFRVIRASTLHNLATVFRLRKQLPRAIELMRRAVADKEAALASEPGLHFRSFSLANSLHNLAGLLIETGKADEATKVLEEALEHSQAALAGNPKSATYRSRFVVTCDALGRRYFESGKADRVEHLAELMVRGDKKPTTAVRAALLVARLLPGSSKARRDEIARVILDDLGLAIGRGYSDARALQKNELLSPLADLPEFKKLIAQIAERKH